MRARSGFSFVEVIITMSIVAVMTLGATMYYSTVLEQTNRDKAVSDLKQIKKVLLKYDSELPGGLTTYTQVSESLLIKDLRKLVEERMMSELPVDPWGNEYRIDIEAGIVYSQGSDVDYGFDYYRYQEGLSVEAAIANSRDDIIVRFKPRFTAERARLYNTKYRHQLVSIIAIDFTRPVDYTTVTTDTCFEIQPVAPVHVTTAIVNILNRRQIKLRMSGTLGTGTIWSVKVFGGTLTSVDTTALETDTVLACERPHEL